MNALTVVIILISILISALGLFSLHVDLDKTTENDLIKKLLISITVLGGLQIICSLFILMW